MTKVTVTEFRSHLRDYGNSVAYNRERIKVDNHNEPMFAVVPIEDLELLEMLEDKVDLELAREALKRSDFVSWEEAKKELGI